MKDIICVNKSQGKSVIEYEQQDSVLSKRSFSENTPLHSSAATFGWKWRQKLFNNLQGKRNMFFLSPNILDRVCCNLHCRLPVIHSAFIKFNLIFLYKIGFILGVHKSLCLKNFITIKCFRLGSTTVLLKQMFQQSKKSNCCSRS